MVDDGWAAEMDAGRLSSAIEPDEFGRAVRSIQVRRVRAKLNAAVESGRIAPEDASTSLERLQDGKQRRFVRAPLRDRASGEVASLCSVGAILLAESHGPGANPWWGNLILVIFAGIVYSTLRLVRKKRSKRLRGTERARRR